MRILKVLLWTSLLLLLVIGGLLIAANYIDWNSYRPDVERLVKEATGRDLKIKGDLDFKLFPTPRIAADGLSFANAAWASKAEMIEAKSLALGIVPQALLMGKIRLRSIALEQAVLQLETDKNGRGNWEFQQASGDQHSTDLFKELARIRIDGLKVYWRPHSGKAGEINVDQALLARPLIAQGVKFSVTGSVDGNPVTLKGKIDSLGAFLQGKGLSGEITRSSPKLEIHLAGDFGQLPALDGLDITVKANGSRWPLLAVAYGLPAGDTPPWKTQFKLTSTANKWTVADFDAQAADSEITGGFSVLLGGSRPKVQGKLGASKLDLTRSNQWMTGEISTTGDAEAGSHKFFSDQPVQTGWMRAVDLDLQIKADSFLSQDLSLENADIVINLEDGKFDSSADAEAFGGQVKSHLATQAVGDTLEYRHRLELKDGDVAAITGRWSDPPLLEGKGSVQYAISGAGRSVAGYMADASGSLRVLVGEGTARAGLAERAARGLLSNMFTALLASHAKDQVKMNCLAAQVTIEKGVAVFDVLVLDTDKATLVGKGSANLGTETWDMKFTPKPKHVTLNASVSVTMTGPFEDPRISVGKAGLLKKLAGAASIFVFPPAAVVGLGELGSGNNVCLKFISEGGGGTDGGA
ncbi:MAG: AsmA family protein [Gammaproteobacteria bacterium]